MRAVSWYTPRVRFVLGFVVASLMWGGAAVYLHQQGQLFPPDPEPLVAASETTDTPVSAPKPKHGKKKRRVGAQNTETGADGNATQTVGEDIGWDAEQRIDMVGGEQQLTGSQIEAGFDSAMPGIRRCLVLVPADGEISGKLVFGMRVGPNGTPKAVNLTGPRIVTGGEAGDCLRRVAQSIRFAAFQGPDMVFKYPITLQ